MSAGAGICFPLCVALGDEVSVAGLVAFPPEDLHPRICSVPGRIPTKNFSPRLAALVSAGAPGISAAPTLAAPIAPPSYSMPNGDGQASGGSYNYWDRLWTGLSSTTTDGAAPSGAGLAS